MKVYKTNEAGKYGKNDKYVIILEEKEIYSLMGSLEALRLKEDMPRTILTKILKGLEKVIEWK